MVRCVQLQIMHGAIAISLVIMFGNRSKQCLVSMMYIWCTMWRTIWQNLRSMSLIVKNSWYTCIEKVQREVFLQDILHFLRSIVQQDNQFLFREAWALHRMYWWELKMQCE